MTASTRFILRSIFIILNLLPNMPKTKVSAKAVTESKTPKQILADKKKAYAEKAADKSSKTKVIKKSAPATGGMKDQDKKKQRFK